jgi:hypothetical protein
MRNWNICSINSLNNMNILLGALNAKIDRKDIFKLTIGNKNIHKISNNGTVTSINILGRLQMGKTTIRLTTF